MGVNFEEEVELWSQEGLVVVHVFARGTCRVRQPRGQAFGEYPFNDSVPECGLDKLYGAVASSTEYVGDTNLKAYWWEVVDIIDPVQAQACAHSRQPD